MKYLLKSICFIMLTSGLYAQDAHYWTEQYGTRSMLLSNSNIGSVEDLGAVFYNPARLSLIEENAFLISGKVYQLSTYSFASSSEEPRNSPSSQSSFGGAPSLLAGTYRVKGWDKHSFAYSFLGRRRMDINISEGNSTYGEFLPGIPGEEYFSGDVIAQKQFNEEWLGASWAYAPNKKFSVGISNFLSIRKQNAESTYKAQAFTDAKDVETYTNMNSYSYSHIGLVWKVGMAWQQRAVSWGITITTPMISISGDGSFNYERIYTGINDNNPIYELDHQSGLDMTYKTPFSVAAGIGYKMKNGSLHASAEYFNRVDEYTLMTGIPFLGQSTNTEYQAFLIDELNSVLNFGIGYNFVFSDVFNGYLSYSTDFSAAVGNIHDNNSFISHRYASTFNADINHFGGGVVMKFKRADITIGATLATTKYTIDSSLGFPVEGGIGIYDNTSKTDIRWNRWRFIVGISIPFLTDWTKKMENKILNKEAKKEE